MRGSFVDIENEFAEIAIEVDHLVVRLLAIGRDGLPIAGQERWETTLVCASATEKIYTGCERVMTRIAAEIDGEPAKGGDSWHRVVLRRLANAYPGVRGPVISPACYAAMDGLRAFRHRERNSYGIALDLEIVVARARQAVDGFGQFRSEVRQFFATLSDD